MVIEIDYDGIKKMPSVEKIIKSVINTVLEVESINRELEIYVTLTNNERIHQVNLETRKVDRPTDVLSFPMFDREEIPTLKEEGEDADILGDIIISVEKAEEQAKEYGHSFEREIAYLTVHGMFHLLGYDHMIEEEQKEMRKKEEEVLEILKISR